MLHCSSFFFFFFCKKKLFYTQPDILETYDVVMYRIKINEQFRKPCICHNL